MTSITPAFLKELTTEYGSPLYVYEAQRIADNYTRFYNAFSVDKLKVHYACKALTNRAILTLFKALGAGLDCVSVQEVKLGLSVGFAPSDIMYTPNNVSVQEYEECVALGVRINIDNLNMLEYFGINHPNIPIGIRINPHLMAGGNRKISVGHIDSKFGISIHQIPLVLRIVNQLNMHIEGIHVHTGSDIIDSQIFIRAAELIFSVADKFDKLEYIDFGSGFKIAYRSDDLTTDIMKFGDSFSAVFNSYCSKSGKKYELKFEPGKYMVSDAGYFLATTNVVKQTTACTFVGLNTGFNHLIRPMFYEAYHEIVNISNPNGDKKVYTVVGNICETDTFASNRILNEVRKDDIILFKNAGAYCFEMASNYNARFLPAEVLIHKGHAHLIRKRENLDDLIRNQVMPTIDDWV